MTKGEFFKKLVRNILLTLVGVSVGAGIYFNQKRAQQPATTAETVKEKTVLYYFHGDKRCKTCQLIQSQAKEVYDTLSSEQQSKLQWQVVNYQKPGNEVYTKAFDLSYPMVGIARFDTKGNIVAKKRFERVWELVKKDKASFASYVTEEINGFSKVEK